MMVEENMEEIFQREIRKICAFILPNVSKSEQLDIEKRFGKPSHKYIKSFIL